MKNVVLILIAFAAITLTFINVFESTSKVSDKLDDLKFEISKKQSMGTDHSKFEQLNKEFATPQELTAACIQCHNERHKELLKSPHWTWDREEFIEGRGLVHYGKKNAINNFCIGIGGSEKTCTKCHAGFGWVDNTFDFKDHANIDCMICHDNTGTYIKGNSAAGYPDKKVNLTTVALNVGKPRRDNCGQCHYFGGGGNNVKHGDLEVALSDCTKDVDVHLGNGAISLECTSCHTAENHNMKGQMYSVSSMNRDRAECSDCHSKLPHKNNMINEHTLKVACQTCHIPEYAKVNATKMTWDWSTAGRLKDGKPYEEKDKDGNITYLSKKGTFTWGRNVKPEYAWFNGTADHYFLGDQVDTSKVIKINTLKGDYADRDSKIIPVKVHRSKQIFDCTNKIIIQPKLYAEKKGEGAFWKDFDWLHAAQKGMATVGQPFSGKFCFVKTEMSWPINHMVSKKENALKCEDCHTKTESRMAGLAGFYMPGRDSNPFVDSLGWIFILMSFSGVVVHGFARLVSRFFKN